jgi:ABC-type glycerol-3-phosphate transport system substrate-binding protein
MSRYRVSSAKIFRSNDVLSEKKVSRRNFLKYAAGAVVAAGALGAVYYATRAPQIPTQTSTVATTEVAESTTANTRNLYQGTELSACYYEDIPKLSVLKRLPTFESETGVTLKKEVFDEPTMREKMVLDFTSHTSSFDLPLLQMYFTPEFGKAKYFEPLDDYINSKADPEWFGSIDDFVPTTLQALSWDGHIYALPGYELSCLSYVNRDMAEQYYGKVPQTIDEFIEAAEKISLGLQKDGKKGAYGISMRGTKSFESFGSVAGWAWTYGGRVIDEDYRPHVNDSIFIEAVEDYVSVLRKYGPPGQASIGWIEGEQMFNGGQIGIWAIETSDYGPDIENPDMSKVVGKAAYVPSAEGPGKERAQWLYLDGWGINKDSKNKDAAWLFLQWATSKAVQKDIVAAGDHFYPSRKSALDDPVYEQSANEHNMLDYVVALREALKLADLKYWPFVPEFVKIGETLMTEVSSAIAGEQDVKTGLDKAQTKIDQIMRDAGYY